MQAAQNWLGAMLLGAACVAQAGDGWQVQVGGVYQWGMKMDTRGPALTTDHNYSIPPRVRPAQDDAGADLADPDNQTFVDGYVRLHHLSDVDTYNNLTWNWSYNNFADQYNADDQTLAFHRQTAEAATSTGQDEFSAAGVEISFRHDLWNCQGLDVGVKLDLAWFPSAQASQNRTTTSRYDTYYFSDSWMGLGVVPDLPQPYQGPDYYNSGGDDVPLIYYTPVRITDTIEQTAVATRADLYRVRGGMGPTLQVALTDRLRLYATPQLTLSLARANVKRTQTSTTTTVTTFGAGDTPPTADSNEISSDKTAFLAGFLLAAGVDYTFANNWYLGAYIGHEWVPNAMNIPVGPDKIRLDLSGGEVSCYIGRTF